MLVVTQLPSPAPITSLTPPPGCTPHRHPPRGSSCAYQPRRGRTPAASSPAPSTGRHPGGYEARSLPQIPPSCWPSPHGGSPAGGTPRQQPLSSSHRHTPCPTLRRCRPPPGPGSVHGHGGPSAARHHCGVSSSCAVPSSPPSQAWGPWGSVLGWGLASCCCSLGALGFGPLGPGLACGTLQGLASLSPEPRSWSSAGDVALVFSQ